MCGDEGRHQLFEKARQRAEWSTTQLWMQYLAVGGSLDLFTVEAYLHGLAPLPTSQQDVLANALNERLNDLYQAAKLPYLHLPSDSTPPSPDPVRIINELLRYHPPTHRNASTDLP